MFWTQPPKFDADLCFWTHCGFREDWKRSALWYGWKHGAAAEPHPAAWHDFSFAPGSLSLYNAQKYTDRSGIEKKKKKKKRRCLESQGYLPEFKVEIKPRRQLHPDSLYFPMQNHRLVKVWRTSGSICYSLCPSKDTQSRVPPCPEDLWRSLRRWLHICLWAAVAVLCLHSNDILPGVQIECSYSFCLLPLVPSLGTTEKNLVLSFRYLWTLMRFLWVSSRLQSPR